MPPCRRTPLNGRARPGSSFGASRVLRTINVTGCAHRDPLAGMRRQLRGQESHTTVRHSSAFRYAGSSIWVQAPPIDAPLVGCPARYDRTSCRPGAEIFSLLTKPPASEPARRAGGTFVLDLDDQPWPRQLAGLCGFPQQVRVGPAAGWTALGGQARAGRCASRATQPIPRSTAVIARVTTTAVTVSAPQGNVLNPYHIARWGNHLQTPEKTSILCGRRSYPANKGTVRSCNAGLVTHRGSRPWSHPFVGAAMFRCVQRHRRQVPAAFR